MCLCHSEAKVLINFWYILDICLILMHVISTYHSRVKMLHQFHDSFLFILWYTLFFTLGVCSEKHEVSQCAKNMWKVLLLISNRFWMRVDIPWVMCTRVMIQARQNVKAVLSCLRRRQYDPSIIERTIGLVLGPFTASYRSFLKLCTLTNKAVGTIWRALSKPPQRRQGPDPRPLWLLVGTPSAFGPELAYRLRVA